jgi:hypothetical protein
MNDALETVAIEEADEMLSDAEECTGKRPKASTR